MEYSIKIKGLDKFRKALSQYPSIAKGYFAEAIAKSTLKAEGTIKKRTPVDTGLLRGTIYGVSSPAEGKVVPMQNYAMYVHEGTRYQRSQPFLVEGLSDAQGDIQRYFNEALEKTLKEVARRS